MFPVSRELEDDQTVKSGFKKTLLRLRTDCDAILADVRWLNAKKNQFSPSSAFGPLFVMSSMQSYRDRLVADASAWSVAGPGPAPATGRRLHRAVKHAAPFRQLLQPVVIHVAPWHGVWILRNSGRMTALGPNSGPPSVGQRHADILELQFSRLTRSRLTTHRYRSKMKRFFIT
jgi:hypothetical protein